MGKMEAAEQTGLAQPSPNSPGQIVTLRQLSTELQQGWIERLFSRLAALYGASFGRQWEGTNLSDVKAVWAEKLGGFTAAHIGGALKSCDDRPYPPNLPEFISLCRDAAKRDYRPQEMLSAPPADPAVIAKAASVIKRDNYDYKAWARELRSRYLTGEILLPMQVSMASEALGEVWEKRNCVPRQAAA